MKKTLRVLTAAAVMLALLAGCGILDGEVYSVTEHKLTEAESVNSSVAAEVKDYDQLYSAVLAMVKSRNEKGSVRFTSNYNGSIEDDVSEVCMDVSYNTPLGAYAVYYMSSSVSKYVSYYEADIAITYKKTAEQISSITDVSTMSVLDTRLADVIENFGTYFVFETRNSRLTADYIAAQVKSIYYENPAAVPAYPAVTVNTYPETGSEHVIEVNIEYPEEIAVLRRLVSDLDGRKTDIQNTYGGQEDSQIVLNACRYLAGNVELSETYSDVWSASDTAYSALISGKADSKGFAMALKYICDTMDVRCYVVSGRYDNVNHYWNIVRIGSSCYHVDASKITANGEAASLFLSDDSISGSYWWDTEQYIMCKGKLTYADIVASQQGESVPAAQPSAQTEASAQP